MASDLWLRTIMIVRKETRCCHIGYSYRLTARVLLYAPSHIQDNTYHSLCYTSRGALTGTRNSSVLLYAPSQKQANTYHSLCYTSRGALARTRNSSMVPSWRIDLTIHRTIKNNNISNSFSSFGSDCAIHKEDGLHRIMNNTQIIIIK